MRSPELAREFARRGAEVRVVMSQSATQLVAPMLMHWATGKKVVTELTGEIEHIALSEWADAVVVAPATANTLGKMANGIADTPVTAVFISAVGLGKRIFVVPAMHASMYSSKPVRENLAKLNSMGVVEIKPHIAEGKAKVAGVREIVEWVMSDKGRDMEGMKVLVTGGPTVEPIDRIKMITNRSSGKMGVAVARAAFMRGAEVTFIYGPGVENPPSGVRVIRVWRTQEMKEAFESELKHGYDIVVATAAAQDLMVENPLDRKLRSTESVELKLVPAPRIVDGAKRIAPKTFVIVFKAEYGATDEELVRAAEAKLEEGFDMVVANDVSRPGIGFGEDMNEVMFVQRSGVESFKGRKDEIAHRIFDIALKRMRS